MIELEEEGFEDRPKKGERGKRMDRSHLESPEDEAAVLAYEETQRDELRTIANTPAESKTVRKKVNRLVQASLVEAMQFYIAQARNVKNPAKFRAEMWDRVTQQGLGKPAPQAPIKQPVKKQALSLGGMPKIPNDKTNSAAGFDLGAEEQDWEDDQAEVE